ncbi:STE3 Pheromone a factor receptor [Candida maltosa Xu316]|uniref:A-factor pheromone receptor, putative n=1 Tax=Candida maltosa (strain Xu316) TaxID=1245528 RepID=M3HKA7_CANMX|nr:A-factor pheromone receptor, putative [Candida maltosa Xu316]
MLSAVAGIGAFSLIAFILLIPPWMWHIRSKNIPASILIFWLMYVDLNGFISSMVWGRDDFENSWDGKVWCDITIRLDVGATVGKCSAIACLAMNLFMLLYAKHPIFLNQKSWKKIAIDLSMCLITPIFVMVVQYVILYYRYCIVRYQGCTAIYATTNATIGLYVVWPLVWSLVALVFGILTLVTFFKKRKDVKDILLCTNSGLNITRFARLLIFSCLIVLAMLPLAIYYFFSQANQSQYPFVWREVHHSDWGEIYFYDLGFFTLYDKLVNCIVSVLAFLIFGLGSDAIGMYKGILSMVGINFKPKSAGKEGKELQELPSPSLINTNKSQITNTTPFTNTSTLRDIENQFADIIHEVVPGETNPFATPATLTKENQFEEELRDLIQDSNSSTENFSYKYEVKQKPT